MFKQQLQSILGIFEKLSFNQRILLGTLAIAAVFTTIFLFTRVQEDYDVMLSNLDESDAAAVVHNLKKQGVPFRLAENGTTILVPRSKKEELRLDAFKDDLIKSDKTVGFGALKSLPFGMTDWQQQKYDQKIISDEVVNTLEKIQGIRKARVILAQSQESLFASEKVDPTASVMLIVEPGLRLKPDQVKTVKNLVARSVPGMKAENVTVSDSMGNELDGDVLANANGGGPDDQRSVFEKQKAKDILEMLAPVVGANNAVVKVSADMNFDRSESKIKRFIPSGGSADSPMGIPVSVQQNTEDYTGQGKEDAGDANKSTAAGGQPGTASNVPSYVTNEPGKSGAGKQGSDYKNHQTTTNYEVSSEEKTIVHAPGTVEKMSVAVIVNKVLTESESDELKQLVMSASGANADRGDAVTISGLQFSPELKDQEKQSMDILKQSNLQDLIINLAQILGIVVLALAALFIFYKLLHRPVSGELVAQDEYGNTFDDESDLLLSATSIPALEARLDPEIEQMRESIHGMVHKDPAEAARVLVTFMKDM